MAQGGALEIDKDVSPSNEKPPETIDGDSSSESHAPSAGEIDVPVREEKRDVEVVPVESNDTPPAVKVSHTQRRGFFGRFTFIAEVEEPKHYSRAIKWFITFIVASAAVAAPLGSAIIFPALLQISKDLHTTPTITNLSSALYMLSMAIFPLWWSSFSETFGRRNIYLISFAFFLLWNILAAVSVNISMLLVMRILGGGAAASVQAVGAGSIADVWEVRERGKAMGIFYLGPLMGPLFAPIIGGALVKGFGWRSTLWFLAIYGGVILVFIFFALPETLENTKPAMPAPSDPSATLSRTTSRASSAAETTKKYGRALRRFLIEPLGIILYLRFPAILITVYCASVTFGALYILNISLEATFSTTPYSYTSIIVGLLYIPASIGYLLASVFGGRWTDRIMAREARRAGRYLPDGKLAYQPEDRMRENAWVAAIMYPGALLWYGWAADRHTFWLVPLIGNFFFGIGAMLIFSMATTMLTEFMPRRASSGVAVNNLLRNIFSAGGAVLAEPLIEAIGNGWLFTIVAFLAATSLIVVWAMRRFGPRWRERMIRELG